MNVIYDNPLPFYRVLISRGDDGNASIDVSEEASLFSDKTKDILHKKQLNLDRFQKLTRERARYQCYILCLLHSHVINNITRRMKQKEINTKNFNEKLKKTKQLSTITTPSVPIKIPSPVSDTKKTTRKTSAAPTSNKSDFVKAMSKASVNLSVLAKRL